MVIFVLETVLGSTSGEETPPPKKRVLSEPSCCEEDCELYFPGDCELLLHEQWRSGGGCGNCNTSEVWGSACSECAPPQKTLTHHSCARELRRLRDELSREGDQLLSDLQRIVLFPTIESTTIVPQNTQQCHDYRKRRHSGAPATVSFAQRINAWPPQFHSLLRPVTL